MSFHFFLFQPDPLLDVHYFWQREVFGDDPFTPEVEPPVPFYLGVLIHNAGGGTAHELGLSSGQPEIVENEKGLLITFKIVQSRLNYDEVFIWV